MPAAIQNETTVVNQNPLAAFDALGIDPKARFQFGKWKTFTVEWVRKVEPSYLRWLGDEDWFRADHQRMVTVDKAKQKAVDRKRTSRRSTEPSVQPDDIQLWAREPDRNVKALDLDQTESIPPPRAPIAFSVAGNVIRPAAWSQTR
jgi:hypothetical protein